MIFEEQIQLSTILKGVLINENDNDILASARGLQRKMKSSGIDPHNIMVYDDSDGSVSRPAAKAIREKEAYVKTMNAIVSALNVSNDLMNQLEQGYKSMTVTISAGAENVGQTKIWMKDTIRNSGKDGISRLDLRNMDPANRGVTRRFSEIIMEGAIFEVNGNLIHVDFKDHYPNEYKEFEQSRLERIK